MAGMAMAVRTDIIFTSKVQSSTYEHTAQSRVRVCPYIANSCLGLDSSVALFWSGLETSNTVGRK